MMISVTLPFLFAVLSTAPSPQASNSPDLFEEFRAVCLEWDGDPQAVEEIALERGYEPSQELIPDDLFQRQGLRVWSRRHQESEWRILLWDGRRLHGFGGGTTYHNRCYVSSAPGDRRLARRRTADHVGFPSFRQKRTDVFAWLPGLNGERERVRRNAFEHRGLVPLTDRSMRMILVNDHEGQVMLTYLSPVCC